MSESNHTDPSGGIDKHVHELEALYRISQVLASDTHQRSMLTAVLDVLHDRLGMTRGTIMLLSQDSGELLIEVAQNLSEKQLQAVRYQSGEGITGRVVQSGIPAIVPKVSREPMFLDRVHRRKNLSKDEISFICVPILIKSRTVGTLSADRIFDESIPLNEDVRVLSIVASMVANNVQMRRELASERQLLEDENVRLRSELEDRFRPENIVGNSRAMREVYTAIHQVAGSDTTVLVRGESGTGKELVAHAIHHASPRARGPFVKVNCAALSENLLESELFGHEKGAFTGAISGRTGRLEQAEGGTLFLDEIGDFSAGIQVKLLRVLQDRSFERVGSNKTIRANVRIVCATNRDLEQALDVNEFRRDLYYRINVFPIVLPPLRERRDDILLLADYFVERYADRMDRDVRRISTPAINMMMAYHWPGNVRELENCIERAVLLSSNGAVHGHHLPPTLQTSDFSDTMGTGTLEERVALFERDIIVDALKRSGGNMAAAARDLGSTARILRYRIKQLDIKPRNYRTPK